MVSKANGCVGFLHVGIEKQRKCLSCLKMFKSKSSSNRRCHACSSRLHAVANTPEFRVVIRENPRHE